MSVITSTLQTFMGLVDALVARMTPDEGNEFLDKLQRYVRLRQIALQAEYPERKFPKPENE